MTLVSQTRTLSGRSVGSRAGNADDSALLLRAFAPLHRVAMGIAGGVVGGGLLAIVSLVLLLRGTDEAMVAGALLGQFLWGYTVSARGVFLGLIWGFVLGFALGYGFALIRNGMVWLWLTMIRSRAEMDQYSDFLDHL
jgi:hypothetical protein